MKRKYRIKLMMRYGRHGRTDDTFILQKRISIFGISFWINVKQIDGHAIYRRWEHGLDHDRPSLGFDEIMKVAYYDMHGYKITNG